MADKLSNEEKVKQFQQFIINWFLENGDEFPWRSVKGKKVSPWKVAVGEVLLNRVPAERVLPVFNDLIEKYPSPEELTKANLNELKTLLQPLGLQEKKARTLKQISEIFVQSRGENALKLLRNIKGIGKNTLNAVALFGFSKKAPLMDGVIGRVLGRIFGKKWKGKAITDKKAWELSQSLIANLSPEETKYFYYGVLDLGRRLCKKSNPNCNQCPVVQLCTFHQKHQTPSPRRTTSSALKSRFSF